MKYLYGQIRSFRVILDGVIKMNTFQDNYFDFKIKSDLNLHYCGNREASIDHRYKHKQAAYLLTFVVSGEAVLTVRNKKYDLSTGDFCTFFPRSNASYITKSGVPWSIRWVTLTGDQLQELLPMLGFTPENPIIKVADPSEIERILEKLFVVTPKDDLRSKISALSLIYQLFSQLAKSSVSPIKNEVVADAAEYISRHYNRELTVESLAQRAFLNANYFSKLFTANVGITPQQLIIRTRMEKAKELLLYSELSAGEIASAVGFSDALYFSRAFKKYTGTSPSEFRKQKTR